MKQLLPLALLFLAFAWAGEPPGYDDTPQIPNSPWKVHDKKRPVAKVIEPGEAPTEKEAGKPPSDAIVLFNGKDLAQWAGTEKWKLENGLLVAGTGDIATREDFGAVQLHLEWTAPKPPRGGGQGRCGGGIFMMGMYEIQLLDSYENKTYPDGMNASIYGQYPPLVNAMRPPGEWNEFDIIFTPPTFDAATKKVLKPARVTAFHNGVAVHINTPLMGAAAHRALPQYNVHGPKGSILLQSHNSGASYRNIWARRLRDYDDKPLEDQQAVKPPAPPEGKKGDF